MSMKRQCYFCGKPVDIRRQMSTFCSSRCEALEKSLPAAERSPHPAHPPAPLPASPSPPESVRAPLAGK